MWSLWQITLPWTSGSGFNPIDLTAAPHFLVIASAKESKYCNRRHRRMQMPPSLQAVEGHEEYCYYCHFAGIPLAGCTAVSSQYLKFEV